MNGPKEREKQKVGDAAIIEPGLISQFRALAHVLLVSPQRNAIVWLALGLVVIVGATAYAQIELNAWNQPFYDAINRKDLSGVGRQLGVYGIIAGALALGYPDPSSKYSNQEFISALEQLGLTQLVPSLDVVARWDHELTAPEQQTLAFARLFLHKPRWVIIDAALETLAPEARRTFVANFQKELPDSALISISDVSATGAFFRRVVNLKLDVSGQRLAPPI
ncbi:hypothetical protein [Methylocystis rosea]|uniref:ABC transporter ATP-binding protein n=1 Tax=Methylocystis rosea TaxID=173366 RepID=A0A3G8MAC0_9HYPH|nr:hypothetical protein [Methylocystis rosea]AZG78831.1 hypothetical protein EHO51_18525 [Methylocystis rosea]